MMFKEIELLNASQIEELRQIAASANFVDGRISNPHSKVKQNLQLHDEAAYRKSSQLLSQAMLAHEDFRNFAFPVAMLPPLMTRYTADMHSGAHAHAPLLQLCSMSVRSALRLNIFLSPPNTYASGALRNQPAPPH